MSFVDIKLLSHIVTFILLFCYEHVATSTKIVIAWKWMLKKSSLSNVGDATSSPNMFISGGQARKWNHQGHLHQIPGSNACMNSVKQYFSIVLSYSIGVRWPPWLKQLRPCLFPYLVNKSLMFAFASFHVHVSAGWRSA
jgi:hypothetical protein